MALARSVFLAVFSTLAVGCAGSSSETNADRNAATQREGMTPRIDELVRAGRFSGEAWRTSLSEMIGRQVTTARIDVSGDLLVVQDDKFTVHALEMKSGTHRFLLDLPSKITQDPGGNNQMLAFVCTDDLVVVDRKSGSRQSSKLVDHLDFFPSGRAVVAERTALIGRLAPYSVQALALGSGLDGWSYATRAPVIDMMNYGDGPLAQTLGATEDGLVFSLPPSDAMLGRWAPRENWYHRIPSANIVTPLALSGTDLFFGADSGFLYRMDVRSGTVAWKVSLAPAMRGHTPVVAGGIVFQRADDQLFAVSVERATQLWTVPQGLRLITRIADRCYVEMPGDVVSVRSAATGAEIGTFSLAGLPSTPTIQGGGLFVTGDRDGNVFALK